MFCRHRLIKAENVSHTGTPLCTFLQHFYLVLCPGSVGGQLACSVHTFTGPALAVTITGNDSRDQIRIVKKVVVKPH